MSKKERSKYIKEIIDSGNYEEALKLKEELEEKGIKINKKIYYELLQKCSSSSEALRLKVEMETRDVVMDEEIYISLIRKSFDFDYKMQLLKEMETKGLTTTIKTYYTLIKYENNFSRAYFLFNKMKSNNIEPDNKLYELIIRKSLGSVEYPKLIKEKANFDLMKQFLAKINSYEHMSDVIRDLRKNGLLNDENVSKVITYLSDKTKCKSFITMIIEKYLEATPLICLNFFLNFACQFSQEDKDFLKGLINKLSLNDRELFTDRLCEYLGVSGGKGHFYIELDNLIGELVKEASETQAMEDQVYLLGKVAGLDENLNINEQQMYIEELELDYNEEFIKYEIIYARAIIKGQEIRNNLLKKWVKKRLPILIICFITDKEILENLKHKACSKGFYPYELYEINQLNLPGFLFTDSIKVFEQCIKMLDYNLYDVAVNILAAGDSRIFAEHYPEAKDWLYKNRGTSFINIGFYDYKKEEEYTTKFSSLYKNSAFSISS